MVIAAKDLPLTREQLSINRPTRGAALATRALALLYAASPLTNGNNDEYAQQLLDDKGNRLLSPEYDESKTIDDEIEIPVQVNGKLRSVIKINKGATSEEVERIALADEEVKKFIDGKEIVKKIYVPERIFTIVAK